MHGAVALAASVGDASITAVRFSTRAKGATPWYVVGEDYSAPFTRTWATTWVSNGLYEIRAEAWSGSTLRATGIATVTVAN